MTDPEPTLLLTRPEDQSKAFLAACEARAGRRLPAIISPLMRVVPTGFTPDLDAYETVILTSGNGVRRLSELASLRGRSVATVGEKTAELARSAGAEARALGEDVESFLEPGEAIRGPAIFCRGVHSRGDLAGRLRARGLKVDEAVIYDQIALPLSCAARQLLAGKAPVVAPVFSPRTAALLKEHGDISAPLIIIAMSPAIADALGEGANIEVARHPTSEAMQAAVLAHF